MSKTKEQIEAEEAAAKAAAEKAAVEEAAATKAEAEDNGLRPRKPAKVGKSIKVLSKGKTMQVVTDGVHTWKEAIK